MRLPALLWAASVLTIHASVASVASAAIVGIDGIASVSGDFQIVSAPPSVERQVYESDSFMRVFLERDLDTDSIPVNAVVPGVYHAYSDFQDQTVDPGQPVRSYFIHFDPVGTSDLIKLSGTVTFEDPILAVIGRSLTMQDTDHTLGAPSTGYPTNRFNRELEYESRGSYDYFEWEPDGHSIFVNAECSTDVDQIRIITAAPEPASAWLAFAAIAVARTRRARACAATFK